MQSVTALKIFRETLSSLLQRIDKSIFISRSEKTTPASVSSTARRQEL